MILNNIKLKLNNGLKTFILTLNLKKKHVKKSVIPDAHLIQEKWIVIVNYQLKIDVYSEIVLVDEF